jgi:hypothetical protein
MNTNIKNDGVKLKSDQKDTTTIKSNMSTRNPFMKKTTTKKIDDSPKKNDRWANLDISEPEEDNRFISNGRDDDDTFRKKGNAFSRNSHSQTSRNFRKGETFNYSLQYENKSQSSKYGIGGGSRFMKFTKPRPPTPPPEFNLDKMEEDFPTLA